MEGYFKIKCLLAHMENSARWLNSSHSGGGLYASAQLRPASLPHRECQNVHLASRLSARVSSRINSSATAA
jgi:hypothetical protein